MTLLSNSTAIVSSLNLIIQLNLLLTVFIACIASGYILVHISSSGHIAI